MGINLFLTLLVLVAVCVFGGAHAHASSINSNTLLDAAACQVTNTTFITLENICIHSDHAGACGTPGQDTWNVVMNSVNECQALCCKNRDVCAAYIFYESYANTCCTGSGCHGDITTPPSQVGAPCCWLKSAVSPANKWSNSPYCTAAGVVYVPGDI
jgi:hypothetical protein